MSDVSSSCVSYSIARALLHTSKIPSHGIPKNSLVVCKKKTLFAHPHNPPSGDPNLIIPQPKGRGPKQLLVVCRHAARHCGATALSHTRVGS